MASRSRTRAAFVLIIQRAFSRFSLLPPWSSRAILLPGTKDISVRPCSDDGRDRTPVQTQDYPSRHWAAAQVRYVECIQFHGCIPSRQGVYLIIFLLRIPFG